MQDSKDVQDVPAVCACKMCMQDVQHVQHVQHVQDVQDVPNVSVCCLLFAVCCLLFADPGRVKVRKGSAKSRFWWFSFWERKPKLREDCSKMSPAELVPFSVFS